MKLKAVHLIVTPKEEIQPGAEFKAPNAEEAERLIRLGAAVPVVADHPRASEAK